MSPPPPLSGRRPLRSESRLARPVVVVIRTRVRFNRLWSRTPPVLSVTFAFVVATAACGSSPETPMFFPRPPGSKVILHFRKIRVWGYFGVLFFIGPDPLLPTYRFKPGSTNLLPICNQNFHSVSVGVVFQQWDYYDAVLSIGIDISSVSRERLSGGVDGCNPSQNDVFDIHFFLKMI